MSQQVDDLDDFEEAWSRLEWRSETIDDSPSHIHPTKNISPMKSRTPRKSPSMNRDRRTSWRDDVIIDKENALPASPPKSLCIATQDFYRKRPSDDHKQEQRGEELKETIKKSLLTQGKLKHMEKLESRRKVFRKATTLKIWPLQDMAMDHLNHLLDITHSSLQFHGGDCLSSESSSSTGSATHGGKRLQKTEAKSPAASMKDENCDATWLASLDDKSNPLWSKEPRIFATEKAQGKRKYLVGHFGRIADWYWRKCVNKHLYEVIREQTPCRLYFDLEYSKKLNGGIHEENLMGEFREELIAEFKTYYDVTLERCHIIDLDSSSDDKFSRHWIVDLDHEGFFEDAPTAGRFVKRLVGRLAEELATNQLKERRPTLAQSLFVRTKEANKPTCFVDLGVYTRNRLFRCFGSSKYGKTSILKAADSNLSSLVSIPTVTSKSDDGLSHGMSNMQATTLEEYVRANNWEPHASALAATLVVPLGGSEGKRIFRVEDEDRAIRVGEMQGYRSGREFQPPISIYASRSPLPSLEKYVLEVLGCRGGTQGLIRAWSIEYSGPRGDIPLSITFQLCRNRYCELIGRSHKSNNIFWTIIFDSWMCVQGCHDRECFGRGAPVPIREDYLLPIREEFKAWRDEEFEKALMALNLDELPTCTNDSYPAIVKIALESPNSITILDDDKDDKQREALLMTRSDDQNCGFDTSNSSFLSDDALLEAISANPEFFP